MIISIGQLIVEINSIMSGRSPSLYYTGTLIAMQGYQRKDKTKQKRCSLKENHNVVIIHCFIGCKDKTSTRYLDGFPEGSNLGSTI